jgi:2-iminobutanoate/2-iminopropanoate deaminase
MLRRDVIHSQAAPPALGPYSQAVRVGDLVFTSGQIPIDPATGELVTGDIAAQTRQVIKNLAAVLEAAGSELSSSTVVKTTIFLVDLADFGRVNEAYGSFFPGDPPARSTVQVAALPKGSRLEIEAVAICK